MVATRSRKERSIQLLTTGGIRPPLKWAGGKRWLVPFLQKLWEPYQNYRLVEPFCGGLAITLGLQPKQALLNDINPHPVNFYHWLKKGFISQLSMHNEETIYYQYRKLFNELVLARKETSKQAAELFYYLNRTGYNGLCRFNRKGEFNVPFGRYDKINYLSDFTLYKKIFADWEIQADDFINLPITKHDFIYADPPYDVQFRQYAKEGFSWSEQVRLAEWLATHKGPIVLSNQATDRVVKLYKGLGFKIKLLDAPRMISCTGNRTKAREVIATKGFS